MVWYILYLYSMVYHILWYITVWYIPLMWYNMVYTIQVLWYHSCISQLVYHTCDMEHYVCDIPCYITKIGIYHLWYTNHDWYIPVMVGISHDPTFQMWCSGPGPGTGRFCLALLGYSGYDSESSSVEASLRLPVSLSVGRRRRGRRRSRTASAPGPAPGPQLAGPGPVNSLRMTHFGPSRTPRHAIPICLAESLLMVPRRDRVTVTQLYVTRIGQTPILSARARCTWGLSSSRDQRSVQSRLSPTVAPFAMLF